MINILGINISTLKKSEVLKKIEQFLNNGGQHYIVTPNPEIILETEKDEEFFYILNKASLAIPDGIGLKFAAWMMGKNIKRFTGVDLVKSVLQLRITNYQLRIAVINWNSGLSKKENIKKILDRYKLKNLVIDINRNGKIPQEMVDFKPDILFCTLGAPYQEKFIYHNLKKLPSVKIGIGVGGAFDFLTGKTKRAPKLLRILGLEWLWRLFKQPKRIKRIYKAVIVFPYKFIVWRFFLPFLYRPNVACLLYKKENNNYKILLAERRDQPEHWQLPQGGTDGEDLITAGSRELSEEIGTDKFKPMASFKNLWKYKFNKNADNYKIKRHLGYRGQRQGLFIAEFFGADSDIKIDFWDHRGWKWVEANNLVNEVHTTRQEATKIFLEKFNNINKKK